MRRLTISVDESLAQQFDELVERKGYLNRSEAFRDLVRRECFRSQRACEAGQLGDGKSSDARYLVVSRWVSLTRYPATPRRLRISWAIMTLR